MIEIAIKIEQKQGGKGIAIGYVPTIGDNATTTEHVYASIVYKILMNVVAPTISEFTQSVGGETNMLQGDKAIFMADQLGWLPPAPQKPEDN